MRKNPGSKSRYTQIGRWHGMQGPNKKPMIASYLYYMINKHIYIYI